MSVLERLANLEPRALSGLDGDALECHLALRSGESEDERDKELPRRSENAVLHDSHRDRTLGDVGPGDATTSMESDSPS